MLCNAVFGDNGRGGDILGAIYNVQGDKKSVLYNLCSWPTNGNICCQSEGERLLNIIAIL